ncbi:MAG: uracil-DNA glycosylase family protein [Chthoniobacterales bacterium]|jgi:uracil-DNA glycosylase|nr:uracil-DNA glycosylase family protein [Chthoniobacterales bacterium]
MSERALRAHVTALHACRKCPRMQSAPVSGGPVHSEVMLVGQAPGTHEPQLGRPFAWTAGKTLFRWFGEACGFGEEVFRDSIYMAAVCRCFPGKHPKGSGDRVPDEEEIANCRPWIEREIALLRPRVVIPVGKLAIAQFVEADKLSDVIGRRIPVELAGWGFDLLALPHPSGASTWHRTEPGKTLLQKALRLLSADASLRAIAQKNRAGRNAGR